MFWNKKSLRVVKDVARATVEQLEARRLLSLLCTNQGASNEIYQILGDDSINNVITVYWDSVNTQLYVKEGSTEVCRDILGATSVKIFGGNSTNPNATSTGADTITINSSNNYQVTIVGQDGNDTLTGAGEVDSISGGNDADVIDGGGGNDSVYGDAGNDSVIGGSGDDTIFGGDGNDTLGGASAEGGNDSMEGGAGSDSINGDANNDSIWGDSNGDATYGGADTIYGGTGTDVVFYVGRTQNHNISLDNTNNDGQVNGSRVSVENDNVRDDIEYVRSGDGNDSIVGSSGDNSLSGGGGDDTLRGLGGADTLSGDNHTNGDWADYGERASNDPLWLTLGDGANDGSNSGGEGDNIDDSIEHILGGAGNDSIVGNGNSNSLNGGDGNDTIWGGGNNDWEQGGQGNDSLLGEAGDDTLAPGNDTTEGTGAYSDTLNGGTGTDMADYSIRTDSLGIHLEDDSANDGSSGEGDYIVQDTIEIVKTGSGSDTIVGGSADEVFYGMQGGDSIVGGAGNDTIYGDSADSLPSSGGDILYGGAGDDVMYGGGGSDTLYGEGDNDTLFDYLQTANDHVFDYLDGGTGTGDQLGFGHDSTGNDTEVNFP
ncbi:MAG TPA: calcium-binding protein [Tepidisphaeraceae bacterium]|nr:calcium-binding protein [Tepidisphaeraceae bacterium]